ncbi:hypothetical protein [Aquibaculum sediminis]|uniref:hypothetical protein n=1 Tax=Aquibaculum sediminis TaxID=3231907 RepID=UPI00345417B4
MASLEVGHVYVVRTTLNKPLPKDKITICVAAGENYFLWFNTKPQPHGFGQLPCTAEDHPALSHDCYLDLSRLTCFSPNEIATARHRGTISDALRERIVQMVEAGIETLPTRHAQLIRDAFSRR